MRAARAYWTHVVLLVAIIVGQIIILPPASAQGAVSSDQEIDELIQRMSVAERVGQLFIITFPGNDVAPDSPIADLIRNYHIGGVLLSARNGNFVNAPVEGPDGQLLDTPAQVLILTNRLQGLAFDRALSTLQALEPENASSIEPLPPSTTEPITQSIPLPLFIGINHEGDGYPYTELRRGFTAIPNQLAIGATWDTKAAETIGMIVGQELAAVGINLLLGPSLDVVDTPRINQPGDLGTRSFGGSPYWVGRMGQAYIRGVHEGSAGRVATVAKHFPGQGSADRRPREEIATVQKPLEALRRIELAPFAAVAHAEDAAAVTEAFMSSHVRYRGFQENTRQLTPPISLAPQLQTILSLDEFKAWREAGGLLISDELGVPSIRRYYSPGLEEFPHRQIALDAFVTGGNDILLLSQFDLNNDWEAQLANIKDTILFFRDRYATDEVFRNRVDASLRRILRLKRHLYPTLSLESALVSPRGLDEIGQQRPQVLLIAQASATLIDPGPQELADRLPSGPLRDEDILIITDSRQVQECSSCTPFKVIDPSALETTILRLYGPQASNQVDPERIHSLTFAQLQAFLLGVSREPPQEELDKLFQDADWIVFAMQDVVPMERPESDSLKRFLSQRGSSLRDKKVIVFSFNAPYYLDPTEISKLTAYFALYSRVPPFLETAARILFREYTPTGRPPISVPGINYDITRQTAPAPGQVIPLEISSPVTGAEVSLTTWNIGDVVRVQTGIILDGNGNPVPDGTLVSFRLRYPAESLELPQQQVPTRSGRAELAIKLERPGELHVTATAGEATQSDLLIIPVAAPTPTPAPEPPTLTPTPSPVPTETPAPLSAPAAEPPGGQGTAPLPRVDAAAFVLALLTSLLIAIMTYAWFLGRGFPLYETLRMVLWEIIGGMGAYVLYGLGWLPGANFLQQTARPWGAGVVTLIASVLPLLIIRGQSYILRLASAPMDDQE